MTPLDAAVVGFRARAEAEGLIDVAYARVPSPVGELIVAATPEGLVSVAWDEVVLDRLALALSPRVLEAPARLDGVRRQLDEYFEGRRQVFDLPIDWVLTRGFRRTVLHALVSGVPFGDVVTYAQLAARVENPKAVRAVGSAMATNPLPIVVPCHRVLRTDGGLGNYSGRDGVVTKRFLLDLESAGPATLL